MNTNTKGAERERSDAKIVSKLTPNEGDGRVCECVVVGWRVLFGGGRGEGGRRGDSEADEGRQAGGGVMRAEQRRLAAGGKRSEVKHERIHHEANEKHREADAPCRGKPTTWHGAMGRVALCTAGR